MSLKIIGDDSSLDFAGEQPGRDPASPAKPPRPPDAGSLPNFGQGSFRVTEDGDVVTVPDEDSGEESAASISALRKVATMKNILVLAGVGLAVYYLFIKK
jgi:hypothetical protein